VLVAAASGNATLSAGGSTGPNTYFAGGGSDLLGGGVGNEVFFAGRGQATMIGGGGADVFAFARGQAGGQVTIFDFNQTAGDRITLQGYTGGTQAALANARVSGGSTALSLSDGTAIMFQNVMSLNPESFI